MPCGAGGAHERAEVGERARGRGGRRRGRPRRTPIAHGEPGSPGCGSSVLLRPLRLRRPIGWIGGQVEHVEAHRGDAGQPLGRRAEGAALDRAVLEPARALGAREELVPGADAGALALDEQFVARPDASSSEVSGRVGEERRDRRVAHDLEAASSLDVGVAQRCGRALEARGAPRSAATSRRPRDRTAGRRVSRMSGGVDPRRDLQIGGVLPRGEVVGERLEPKASRRPARAARSAVSQRSKPSLQRHAGGAAIRRRTGRTAARARRCRSCPSRNAVVRNGTTSPANALGRNSPSGTDGRGQRERDARGRRRAIGLRIGCRSDRDRRGAAPGAGARGARRRDHVSNLPRAPPRATDCGAPDRVRLTRARNRRIEVPTSGTTSPGRELRRGRRSGASSALDHSDTNASRPSIAGQRHVDRPLVAVDHEQDAVELLASRAWMPRRTAACGATGRSTGRSTSSRRARRTSP